MVYLDPEINIIPYPFNFLFFILFLYFSWLTFQQNNLRSFINEYGTKGLFEPRKRVGKLMAFRATETKHKFIHIRHSHFHKKNFLNLNWATRNVNNNSSGLSYKGSQKVIVKKKTKF
jgi:hypothetical protein